MCPSIHGVLLSECIVSMHSVWTGMTDMQHVSV